VAPHECGQVRARQAADRVGIAVFVNRIRMTGVGGLEKGFFGAGVGSSYAKTTGFGVEIAPRGGINLLVGGSGVLTAAFSYVYVASRNPDEGQTEPNSSQTGFQMGYTVAW